MTLSYNYSYGSTTYSVNEQKEPKLKNRALHEVLTLFGQHGWELVGIGGSDGKSYVFKRHSVRSAQSEAKPEAS
jgi:hypothetical protein